MRRINEVGYEYVALSKQERILTVIENLEPFNKISCLQMANQKRLAKWQKTLVG